MPINDPDALEPLTRGAVKAWLAAGEGSFWITSGVRTREEQIQLRIDNGCPDVWTAPPSSCDVTTAIPGTSKHETGEAVDIGGDKARAARLAPRFGLGLTVPGEDWHFEVVNDEIARTYQDKELTVEQITAILAAIEGLTEVVQRQGRLTRATIQRQEAMTRKRIAKADGATQAELDEIDADLARIDAKITELGGED